MKTISKFGGKAIVIAGILSLVLLYAAKKLFKNRPDEPLNYEKITAIDSSGLDQKHQLNSNLNALPVQIAAENNFQDYKLKFYIPQDTTIRVNAVGEAADYATNPFLFKSWDNDAIEVFFDMKNDKSPVFNMTEDDRQYRIVWKSLRFDGQNLNKSGVKVIEFDPSLTSYTIELTFPWKSLGYFSPSINSQFGFDATIIDCDGGSEKAKISWHSKTDDNWKSTSHYGTMILSGSKAFKKDSDYVTAFKRVESKPKGARKESLFSASTPFYEYKNVTVGSVSDSLDLSGKFKAEWDSQNLYIRVKVRDNVKTMAKALFDYGWIEDQSGKIIWRMNPNSLVHAGGALKNKAIEAKIKLKKGIYWLNYHTDESHSPNRWDDVPPKSSFYGISLCYWK